MKKIAICLIISILMIMSLSLFSAFAEDVGEVYVVGSDEVQVWTTDGFEPKVVFSIPKGYGFTITNPSASERFAQIRYSGRGDFFVLKTALATCTKSDSPDPRTPSLIVEISPKTLYGKHTLTEPSDYTGAIMFLGEYKEGGQTLCYAVYKADDTTKTVYYVPKNCVTNRSAIEELLNPSEIKPGNDQKPTPSTPTTDTNDQTPQNKTVLRIILVLGIVIPAFIIILIVFKPGRKKQKVEREVDEGTDAFDNY